jgi:predicted chitinase
VMGNVHKVTRRVNGGTVGLAHRQELTELAGRALG